MFNAVLVANRGEIALRVIRACHELGVRAVAVYSDLDRDAAHVRAADEAYRLGPGSPAESYLHVDRILDAAIRAGVDAVHPGYGFLSENAAFAEAVTDAGLAFVGPPATAIRRMGDKLSARAVARRAGVPVVPGTREPTTDPQAAIAFGAEHGYPVAVKAMFGGGGRGMKVVHDAAQMQEALESARREAEAAFGRGECYLERYLERPRHVEVQLLVDLDGTAIHLGDRDCSLQRRHQKLIEEAPAPGISPRVREDMAAAAVRIAGEMGYTNAGTCEFLLDPDASNFYFLEMNTRLQVEHPVTELVTGVDLVQAQLRIAAGDGMGIGQADVRLVGHAIEVRLNAEDPAAGFRPTPGVIDELVPPLGPWVRLDTGVRSGDEIARDYDSMIGKLIVWADTRDGARSRMRRALDELVLTGIATTVPFARLAMQHPQFVAVQHATISVEGEWDLSGLEPHIPRGQEAPTGDASRDLTIEVDGRRLEVRVFGEVGPAAHASRPRARRRARPGGATAASAATEDLTAPMQGTVVGFAVPEGHAVAAGDLVVVLEAMKMENPVMAHRAGVVTRIAVSAGDTVQSGTILCRIDDP